MVAGGGHVLVCGRPQVGAAGHCVYTTSLDHPAQLHHKLWVTTLSALVWFTLAPLNRPIVEACIMLLTAHLLPIKSWHGKRSALDPLAL